MSEALAKCDLGSGPLTVSGGGTNPHCGCAEAKKTAPAVTFDEADGTIPAPRAQSLIRPSLVASKTKTGGGRTEDLKVVPIVAGGAVPRNSRYLAVAAAVIVALVIVVVILVRRSRPKDSFFTRYAQEQPTRPYVPYTGTIPNGEWGTKPWALAYDLEFPKDEYSYLPPPYYTFQDIL